MKKKKLRTRRLFVVGLLLLIVVAVISIILLFNKKDNSKYLKIELNGDKEISLDYGNEYSELGAKAYYKDKDISKDIKINTNIDITKAGDYKATYTIDYKGIKKTVSRKITVSEEVNPYKVGVTSKGYTIEKRNDIYYINDILIANKTYPLPSSYNPGDLLDVFKDNFNKMQSDANNEGIRLNVISGFRSYSRQNTLYNNYVSRDGKEKADTYSARPGHSEHQTGLAADINDLSQSWENTKEGKWLNNNCYKYGFIIRYVKGKEDITGYIFEPWHIRYVGVELATKLYNNGDWITLEEYLGIDSKY